MKVELRDKARIGVSLGSDLHFKEGSLTPVMRDLDHVEIHPDGPGRGKVGVNLLTPEDRLPACFVVSRHDARVLGEALIEASGS